MDPPSQTRRNHCDARSFARRGYRASGLRRSSAAPRRGKGSESALRRASLYTSGLNEEVVEWRYADCWTGADLPDLSEISGLVVLGGTMNADEVSEHPHLVQVKEIMREAVVTGKPLLGIQLLPRSLGGEVYKAPVKETGFLEVEAIGKDPLLDPLCSTVESLQFHEDTCTLPEGAELLYRSDDVAVQAFKAGERAYGVQFHFEITTTEISNWCEATPDLEAEWRTSKQELLLQADDHLVQQQRTGREVARRFIDLLG